MNDKPTINPQTLPPLTKFIYTLGVLPTSYLMSMTYQEQLVWLCNYLATQVIPAINQNGEAVQELQNLYIQLEDYVNNYLGNDLPEFIKNELDKMVEDGTLESILENATHLIRTYNTENDMILDKDSLLNGAIVYTYGKETINDGDGAKYLINNSSGEIDLENGLYGKILNNIESNFYNFTTYSEEHYNSNCYFVEIPLNDENGNEIEVFTAYHPDQSPNEYAIDEKTSVTVNSSLSYGAQMGTGYPNIIGKGELLVNDDVAPLANNNVYLGIKANRVIQIYDKYATYQQMLQDGVLNNACIWGQTAVSGNYVDIGVGSSYSPRTMLGVKADKTFIFMVVNGRTTIDKGLTFEEATDILLDKSCIDVYALDGGGSSSLCINTVKLNKNIDGHGLNERKVAVTFNVKKQIKNSMCADSTSEIGKAKRNILENIMPIINEIGTTISEYDLNDLKNKLYLSYGANMLNAPVDGYGYVINIPHLGADTGIEYSSQFFIHYQTSKIFKRQKVGDTFTAWESILGNKLYAVYDGSDSIIISADDTYQNCYFRKFQATESDIIEVDTTGTAYETNYYEKLKFNKAGVYKVTAQIFMASGTSGNKNIQISKNDTSSNFNIGTNHIGNGEYGCIETFLVNSFAKNDYIVIKARGKAGDYVVRARVLIEEF